jgi:hypothetical protein
LCNQHVAELESKIAILQAENAELRKYKERREDIIPVEWYCTFESDAISTATEATK